eukprot:564816_1
MANSPRKCLRRVLIVILWIISVSSDEMCPTSYSCIGRALNDTGSTKVYGYRAASTPTTSFSGGTIKCAAAYSCESMLLINASRGFITCEGDHACSNTTMQSNTSIDCDGSYACMHSNTLPSPRIMCTGFRSCDSMNITGVSKVYSRGMLALYNAIIDTIGSVVSTINIYLESRLSAYGASIRCRGNHECRIWCEAIDACYMLNCIGTCVIYQTSPTYHVPITALLALNETETTDYNELVVYKLSDSFTNALCIMDSWSFDDKNEQSNAGSIALTVDNEGPICCRGYGACELNTIEYLAQIKNNLICSSNQACLGSTVQNINDTALCEGRRSCKTAVFHYVNRIYCVGALSCAQAMITGSKRIICNADQGCTSSTIISGGNNVEIHADGRKAAEMMTLYCNDTDECTVYCNGYRSCFEAVFVCNNNCFVHCNDEYDLYCVTLNPSSTRTVSPTLPPVETSQSRSPTQAPFSSAEVAPQISTTTQLQTDSAEDSPPNNEHFTVVLLIGGCIICCVICTIVLFRGCKIRTEKVEAPSVRNQKQATEISQSLIDEVELHSSAPNKLNPFKASLNYEERVRNNSVMSEGTKVESATIGGRSIEIIYDDDNEKHKNVKKWLEEKCRLQEYLTEFISNGFESMDIIKEMDSKSELAEIGINIKGHQTKLWAEINTLKKESNNTFNTTQ